MLHGDITSQNKGDGEEAQWLSACLACARSQTSGQCLPKHTDKHAHTHVHAHAHTHMHTHTCTHTLTHMHVHTHTTYTHIHTHSQCGSCVNRVVRLRAWALAALTSLAQPPFAMGQSSRQVAVKCRGQRLIPCDHTGKRNREVQ